jgi:hypothetical protein
VNVSHSVFTVLILQTIQPRNSSRGASRCREARIAGEIWCPAVLAVRRRLAVRAVGQPHEASG